MNGRRAEAGEELLRLSNAHAHRQRNYRPSRFPSVISTIDYYSYHAASLPLPAPCSLTHRDVFHPETDTAIPQQPTFFFLQTRQTEVLG